MLLIEIIRRLEVIAVVYYSQTIETIYLAFLAFFYTRFSLFQMNDRVWFVLLS